MDGGGGRRHFSADCGHSHDPAGLWRRHLARSRGPAADDQGNIYVMTGNGGFDIKKQAGDTTAGQLVDFNGTKDFAEAFIRFKYQRAGTGKGSLALADWYIPFQDSKRSNQGNPDYQDQDLGGGGTYPSQRNDIDNGRRKRRFS
jgi:hypothetical protein